MGPIDLAALHAERDRRAGHQTLANLRTEAYPAYQEPLYPRGGADAAPLTLEENIRASRLARDRLRQRWM